MQTSITKPVVYFYCNPTQTSLQEDVIALAEGFLELGITFSSNCPYWQISTESDRHLFEVKPDITPDDCDVVVVSYSVPSDISPDFKLTRRGLPKSLFKLGRRYQTVYMDHHDDYRTVSWEEEFRQFDVIFRAKMNRRTFNPSNMKPWAYGLRRMVVNWTSDAPDFNQRQPKILVNFGASHPYSHRARNVARRRFESKITKIFPIDRTRDDLTISPVNAEEELLWRQTGYRFSGSYFHRLRTTQAVACFCGDLIPGLPHDPSRYLVGGKRARIRRCAYSLMSAALGKKERSIQWDSFRFWEALSAGCLSFNLDLDKYGVILPEMPVNWSHYIGIDLDRVEESMDRVEQIKGSFEEIAQCGREWALAHYSPKAVARRFLSALGY